MNDHEGKTQEPFSVGMAAVENTLFWIAFVIIASWCFQWYIHIIAIIYGKWKLHWKVAPPSPETPLPGVSILKPLTGVDPSLYSNLETFFKMDYPTYELLFCVEDDSDPAIMVVKSLLIKYPLVNARLFVGAKKVGINPKINNMLGGYDACSHDLVLISDSGLKMKSDTLLDIVVAMKENVGLVHQMPFVCNRKGFAGVLEKVYFGTQHAKMYLNADMYGINCVTGMSCLFRRCVVQEAGGLRALGQYLAEDYYLGKAFLDRGWKICICSQPAWQNAGNYSIANYQARMIRWAKLRSALIPLTVLLEPISECLLLGVLASWAAHHLLACSPLAFFTAHTLCWFMLDYVLLKVVQGDAVPFSKCEFVIGWLFRELTSLLLMLRAHSDPSLTWRSKRYMLEWGGVGTELRTQAAQSTGAATHQLTTTSITKANVPPV